MNITIKTIPHSEQKYDTCGDWWFNEEENLEIRVSDLGNWKEEYLVADHELTEALLCKSRGITEKEVTDFDLKFEHEEKNGISNQCPTAEPGDDARAPYRNEHKIAESFERIKSEIFGIDWNRYANHINKLSQ